MENVARRRVAGPQVGPLNPDERDRTETADTAKKTRAQQIQERLESAQTREDLLKAKVVEYSEQRLIKPRINYVSSSMLHIARSSARFAHNGGVAAVAGQAVFTVYGVAAVERGKENPFVEFDKLDIRNPTVAVPAGLAFGATLGAAKGVYDVASGSVRQNTFKTVVEKEARAVLDRLLREFPDIHYQRHEELLFKYLFKVEHKKLGYIPEIREELSTLDRISQHGNRRTRKLAEEMVDLATGVHKSVADIDAKRERIQELLESYGRGWIENVRGEPTQGPIRLKEGDYLSMQQMLNKFHAIAMELHDAPKPLED